jgi:hypothetical protein
MNFGRLVTRVREMDGVTIMKEETSNLISNGKKKRFQQILYDKFTMRAKNNQLARINRIIIPKNVTNHTFKNKKILFCAF